MAEIATILSIILAAMVLFIWNRIPAAAVAVLASLALYLTGILTGSSGNGLSPA